MQKIIWKIFSKQILYYQNYESKIRCAVKDCIFTTLFGETKYTLDLYRSLHPANFLLYKRLAFSP